MSDDEMYEAYTEFLNLAQNHIKSKIDHDGMVDAEKALDYLVSTIGAAYASLITSTIAGCTDCTYHQVLNVSSVLNLTFKNALKMMYKSKDDNAEKQKGVH